MQCPWPNTAGVTHGHKEEIKGDEARMLSQATSLPLAKIKRRMLEIFWMCFKEMWRPSGLGKGRAGCPGEVEL